MQAPNVTLRLLPTDNRSQRTVPGELRGTSTESRWAMSHSRRSPLSWKLTDQTYDHNTLDDHLKLSVDVGSNDFAVSAIDAHIAEARIGLDITRTFDNASSMGDTGDAGENWMLDPGTSLGFYPDTHRLLRPDPGAHRRRHGLHAVRRHLCEVLL